MPRFIVKGTLKWEETCAGASGATVSVYDSDIGDDDAMGSGTTSSDGTYSVSVPKIKVGFFEIEIRGPLSWTFY